MESNGSLKSKENTLKTDLHTNLKTGTEKSVDLSGRRKLNKSDPNHIINILNYQKSFKNKIHNQNQYKQMQNNLKMNEKSSKRPLRFKGVYLWLKVWFSMLEKMNFAENEEDFVGLGGVWWLNLKWKECGPYIVLK